MKRRTLDVLFSVGGMALALLMFVLAAVLTSNANFANTYVHDQLSDQKIQFKAAADLTEEERKSACVVKYAGEALTTGKQAECYANDFIGLHVRESTENRSYAELGAPQSALRKQVAAATDANDPALASLQTQLDDITKTRDTAFKGETLRGLLLTSFGFSEFGRKADQAATVSWAVAALLALLALAGLIHAFRTPQDEAFAPPESGK